MNNAGLFLTVKDLMQLNGQDNYDTVRKEHSYIRLALCKGKKIGSKKGVRIAKRKMTIAEYCSYMGLKFSEVWKFLRGNASHPDAEESKPDKPG
ncbi:MAG: hypothetical protein M3R17_08225 [Bacteroidota bacterium]|nr:hypothetical protein [Bacteroidota bacterium]